MKPIIIACCFLLAVTIAEFSYCIWRDTGNQEPAKIEKTTFNYKTGQLLPPDMACQDSLIVRDADGLNKAMANLMQDQTKGSDSDIDSVLHRYCTIAILCPYCGEYGCIYEDIDELTPDNTDIEKYNAIIEVGKARHLTERQLQILFREYNLQ